MRKIIDEYMAQRFEDEFERYIVGAYTYQIFMKPGESEYALLLNFDEQLRAYEPLMSHQCLGNDDFPVPVSIMMGETDWMHEVDQGASQKLVELN